MIISTLFPPRGNGRFHPPDAEPSVRSCTPHRSPARDLRALAPLVGALSTVHRPLLREVASSLSTHELTDVWKTDSSAMTRFDRDRGGSRAREVGRVAERGQCVSGRWCEPAPGHRRRAAPPVSSETCLSRSWRSSRSSRWQRAVKTMRACQRSSATARSCYGAGQLSRSGRQTA